MLSGRHTLQPLLLFFFLMLPPPPSSTLFPYTTLFRSPGRATGSAMPLAWAHAEFVKLLVSRQIGHPFARPREEMARSEEHTSELQSRRDLVCRVLLEKKKKNTTCAVRCMWRTGFGRS